MKKLRVNRFKYMKILLPLFGLMFSVIMGVQYVSSVHVNADSNDSTDWSKLMKFDFYDANIDRHVSSDFLPEATDAGFVGQQTSLVNSKTILEDEGYDVSNVPDTITPTNTNNIGFEVKHISVENQPKNLKGKCKIVFEIKDQNGNYIESKYDSTKSLFTYNTNLNDHPTRSYKKVIDGLKKEENKFRLHGSTTNSVESTDGVDSGTLRPGENIYDINVTAPTHTLTINYINQNGVNVFSTTQQVTNYGHTNFYDGLDNWGDENIKANPNQPYVSNKNSTATINVTTPNDFVPMPTHDYGYATPLVVNLNNPKDLLDDGMAAYYTNVNFVDARGKKLVTLLVSSSESNMVYTNNLDEDEDNALTGINLHNVTDMPQVIDLSKGPYTFHTTDTKSSLKAWTKKTEPSGDEIISPYLIKKQVDQASNNFTKAKRFLKKNTSKLKSLNKKMKKHATKKQKELYKKLKNKISGEQKKVKSTHAEFKKITRYYNDVLTVVSDDKKMSSLTVQMRKLKTKHSAESKKQYDKLSNDLQNIKNSWKSAVKIMRDYK